MANTISTQPSTNSANAAYRPIILNFTVDIAAADCPAAFCDIYINGIYYKSQSKTQPISTVASVSKTFQFDIQDPLQEYLSKYLAANGGHAIVNAATLFAGVFCRFRNTTLDVDGFIVSNGTAPIQPTDSTPAIAGTGLISNAFYVVDSTLQHEENQVLTDHLGYYRAGTWNANMFPLSHRPPGTKIGLNDSDYFPVLNVSNNDLECIKLNYRLKGQTGFTSLSYCAPVVCVPVGTGSTAIPDGVVSVPYSATIPLTGSTPFTLGTTTKPAWLSIAVVGSNVVLSGTPVTGDIGTTIPVSFDVTNDCGTVSVDEEIDVIAFVDCVAVAWDGIIVLPDGVVGTPYSFTANLTGTAPFTLSGITKPAWMTISLSGSTVSFTGTPTTVAATINISVTANNCGATETALLNDTIAITAPGCKLHTYAVFGSDDSYYVISGTYCDGSSMYFYGFVGDGAPPPQCLQIGSSFVSGNVVVTDNTTDC